MIFCLKLVFQRQEVLNDAVVNDDNATRAVAMGMRILFSRPAVRSPTRMTDSVSTVERPQPNGLFKVAQLAFSSANREAAVFIDDRYSRGIVAAVFELLEAVKNYSDDLLVTHVSDYSTHLFV